MFWTSASRRPSIFVPYLLLQDNGVNTSLEQSEDSSCLSLEATQGVQNLNRRVGCKLRENFR